MSAVAHTVAFAAALRVWARIGLLSFGGPAGQIALMHRVLVDEKRWVSEGRFLHALNYCMLLPGPEATQLATYVGWLLHGWRGGLAAGVLFVLPGFLAILALSILYALHQEIALVTAFFFGLKAATLAVVVEALIRIGKRTLKNRAMLLITVAAYTAIGLFEAPFPFVILGAGLLGMAGGRWRPDLFCILRGTAGEELDQTTAPPGNPGIGRALATGATWLAVWALPVAILFGLLGPAHVLSQIAVFFSKAAVVTFGGAYAVLAYMAQQAVEVYGWLKPGEMLDGLGMAETTPGPLIMVTQFVAFMGAYRLPAPFEPLTAALLASCIATWVTFAPCFLWIFLGAPYVERLRENRILAAGLSAITAAVVGVILNLAVWFGVHVLFSDVSEWRAAGVRLLVPAWKSLDPVALGIGCASLFALARLRLNLILVLVAAAATGILAGALR